MAEPSSQAPESPEVARAEELVDRAGHAVGSWASRLGLEMMKTVALAREEAEDIWAEARSVNREGGA